MSLIGDNRPPSQIAFTLDTSKILNAWLTEHPIVETEEQARSGKLLVDRASLCLKDLDDERKGKTQPLEQQVTAINDEYRKPKTVLKTILDELKNRIEGYRRAEEERRQRIAEEARRKLAEAEARAREAEAREHEAKADAASGVESDLLNTTEAADTAFAEYEKAERDAARAERETVVKIGGGFSRALSARTRETLVASDPEAALTDIGWTEKLIEALLTEARAYRREYGKLPAGIQSVQERRI